MIPPTRHGGPASTRCAANSGDLDRNIIFRMAVYRIFELPWLVTFRLRFPAPRGRAGQTRARRSAAGHERRTKDKQAPRRPAGKIRAGTCGTRAPFAVRVKALAHAADSRALFASRGSGAVAVQDFRRAAAGWLRTGPDDDHRAALS